MIQVRSLFLKIMKKGYLIFLFASFLLTTSVYSQKPKNFNGWEFLPWKLTRDSVAKILEPLKGRFENTNALDADFKYEEMNTWLGYDSSQRLVKVHLRKEFSVIYQKDAKAFFKKTKRRLIETYGRPGYRLYKKKDCVKTLIWELKYSRIVCTFDFKYKIIDEFGAGAYWVDLVFKAE